MRYIVLFIFFYYQVAGFSQEVLVELQYNPVIQDAFVRQSSLKNFQNGLDTIPVTIPFFDDFREQTVFPSSDRWIDRYAFVNSDIPKYPVNRGAATLDAINDSGYIYPDAVPGPTPFIADHLTSRYIRLDSVFSPAHRALSPADSVYLSFFYQPQGRAKAPNVNDSLILEFLIRPGYDSITPGDSVIPIDAVWQKMWGTTGMALDTFTMKYNTYFVQVLLPITDSVFFKEKFRFRFYNLASLASSAEPSWQSNSSQWNIDQVYLNSGRTISDTIIPEITFIERAPSFLTRYASMPYPQYNDDPTNEIADTIDMLMSNRDLENHNTTYQYTVKSPNGSFQKTYDAGEYIMKPVYTFGYVTYLPFAHPPVPFLFPINTSDSALFTVKHIVRSIDGSNLGDTMEASQKFYNYYAYDDGTPDAGYGLTPAGSMLAYQFRLNKSPDTLRAVRFFFNHTLGENNVQLFYLTVWNDNAGKPGEILFQDIFYPEFSDSLNQFVTYLLDEPLRISGTFYVGWEQTTDDNLNVGFDRYNDSREYIFYNTSGKWLNSSFAGSLMIRPVIGKPLPVGIRDEQQKQFPLTIYPNPSSEGVIHLTISDPGEIGNQWNIQIQNLCGQQVFSGPFSPRVHVSDFPPGIYILIITGRDSSPVANQKFVIIR